MSIDRVTGAAAEAEEAAEAEPAPLRSAGGDAAAEQRDARPLAHGERATGLALNEQRQDEQGRVSGMTLAAQHKVGLRLARLAPAPR